MIELFSYQLPISHFLLLCLTAMLVGMAKTGISGAMMLAVPLLAIVFGARASTGLLLTILIIADVFGVTYYHQHANWHHLKRLLPFALFGVVLGTMLGNTIDAITFTHVMAVIIFFSLGIMLWQERGDAETLPDAPWFVISIGILGGITTMIGNLAGPIMALYFLAMRFPKNEFIGTAAWFFMVINVAKVPFHVFAWGTITVNSALLSLVFIPAVALGAWLGIRIVAVLSERVFRVVVLISTSVAAVAMLL